MGPKNNEYILRVLSESVKWFAEECNRYEKHYVNGAGCLQNLVLLRECERMIPAAVDNAVKIDEYSFTDALCRDLAAVVDYVNGHEDEVWLSYFAGQSCLGLPIVANGNGFSLEPSYVGKVMEERGL